MEFHVQVSGLPVDLDAVQASLLALDPVAVAALDADGELLRVSAEVDASELADLMIRAGCPVTKARVLEVPPFCCGGCGG